MARNLWVGTPGLLREIPQAAKSWDRSAELNVSEFRALEGQVTTFAPFHTARRLKFSFEGLEPVDAQHLARLARRAPDARTGRAAGPVAVLDPVSVNLLGPAQAAGQSGREDGLDHWFAVSGKPAFKRFVREGWAVGGTVPSVVGWVHGTWPGWPVAPGMTVSWLLPPGWGQDAVARLAWKDADGAPLRETDGSPASVTGVAPADAAFVTPQGVLKTTGVIPLGGACLSIGEAAEAFAVGDGCPAMSVTGYSDVPAARLPYRNVGIDLVEVTRATL
ncbi:hypothetical protein GCM10010252_10250 [Streptomyces aureoverticillatus]|nr:hypothetical protein GCM10010252_10250 [Streptomyces aureoverticillatus]